MLKTAEFWVAISFVIFCALLVWKKVPGMINKALDERADRIREQLAQARKLREEAQSLLAEYEKKREDAEKEAEEIVVQARNEAESYAAEARRKLKESMERRARMAEDKINRAEASAIKEVRSAASNIAIKAARELIAADAKGAKGAALIDASIANLRDRLN